jgi:hypothetical protein
MKVQSAKLEVRSCRLERAKQHAPGSRLIHRLATALLSLVLLASLRLGGERVLAAEPEDEAPLTVIRAGNVITNTGSEIKHGIIVIRGSKIENVGLGLEYPASATVIDARDRTVMPGLINPYSRFGLPPYNRADVHGNWTVADEYFPSPGEYDEILDAGYTVLALYPAGAGIPGRAIVVHTGGPAETRILVSPSYLRVANDKRTFRGALEKAQAEIDKVNKAREEFDKKQQAERQAAEQKAAADKAAAATQPTPPATTPAPTQPAFQPPPIDPAVQVLVDLIQKKPDVFALIELDRAADYAHILEVFERFDVAHAFRAQNDANADFTYVLPQLREKKPRVVMLPIIGRVPNSAERLHLVKMFDDAGCEVSLTPAADQAREHQRIFGRLAWLVRDGWKREAALKAVTLHPARLLGLEARFGTIEKGKEADLIFLDADPLDPTVRVREVLIGGQIVRRVQAGEAD